MNKKKRIVFGAFMILMLIAMAMRLVHKVQPPKAVSSHSYPVHH